MPCVLRRLGGKPGALGVVCQPRVVGRSVVRGERAEDASVQLGAAGGRDRRLDRLADEVVPEPERLAVVGEDAVVERLRDPVLAVGRDEGEHGQRDASPDHGRCIDRAARGRPETPDA